MMRCRDPSTRTSLSQAQGRARSGRQRDTVFSQTETLRAVEHFFKRSTIGGIIIFSDAWPSREGNCDPQKVVPQFGAPAIHELFIRQLGLCFCARADGPE